ncbi:mkkA, partial [Symbiodinium pilosum]
MPPTYPDPKPEMMRLSCSLPFEPEKRQDAAKLYRVLSHRPPVGSRDKMGRLECVQMTMQQRILGFGAFLLQYVVAVVVLLMAIQLILASTTPIATIGKLWVVFTTLDFDNYLCNFILFIFDCEHAFTWEAKLQRRSARRLGPQPF